MLYRTDFDENGRKTLCQMDGVNADMLMDIFVQKLAPGDTLTLEEAEKECAVLLLSGQVTFAVGNSINETCRRNNPFEKKPYAVHFRRGTKATVTAIEGSQVLVQMTDNDRTGRRNCTTRATACTKSLARVSGTAPGTGSSLLCLIWTTPRSPTW